MFHQRELTQFGKIKALEIKGHEDGFCVILFHGYGADCFDLASLSDEVKGTAGLNWVFPQGILDVPIGPGWMGKAWFPIDVAALEEANRTGRARDLSKNSPAGLERARVLAFNMIDKLPFPKSRIIVGGFSQGAMLATDLVMSSQERFAGLVLLSGTLLDEARWAKLAGDRAGMPFFQSHGISDPVLPVVLARSLADILQNAGWDGHLFEFKGGHEIPYAVLNQLSSFIRDRVKRQA